MAYFKGKISIFSQERIVFVAPCEALVNGRWR